MVLLGMCVAPVVFAGADPQLRLQQLRERISELKQELVSMQGKHDAMQDALEKAEVQIGEVSASLRSLDSQAVKSRKAIVALQAEQATEQQRLAGMRAGIERALRSAYISGRQQHVKLLLNQQDPAAVGRMMVYHGYFTRARSQRMQEVLAVLERLEDISRQLFEQQAETARLRDKQQQQAVHLRDEQQKRQAILDRLATGVKDKTGELGALKQDEKQLQRLVESLQKTLQDIPPASGSYSSLDVLKGKLAWPVAGRVTIRYGQRYASGQLSSRGVHIATVEGADVSAIAKGRVAFADWLRGFGLLLIIDHGEGYMSLYGHNRSLYSEVGEWVEGGDVVAAAGSSGGQSAAGLYLEMRKDGRPFNPGAWFAGKPVSLKAAR